MNTKKNVCIVDNDVEFSVIRKLLTSLEKDWRINIIRASTINSFETISLMSKGVIVNFVGDGEDLKDMSNFYKNYHNDNVKILVISKVINPKVKKFAFSNGCNELQDFSTPINTILQSIDDLMTTINKTDRAFIKEVASIKLKADCWYLESPEHIKKVANTWSIYLIGPSPEVVEWQECHDYGKEGYWEFVPKKPKDESLKGESGLWLFKGRKPTFAGSHWRFISDDPTLLFNLNGVADIFKFRLEANHAILSYARNSEQVKEKLIPIEKTIIKYRKTSKDFTNESEIQSEFNFRIKSKIKGDFEEPKASKTINLDDTNKHFTIVDSVLEKKKYLNKISHKSNSLIVWTKGQKTILDATAKKLKDGQYTLSFDDADEGEKLIKELENGNVTQAYVRGNLDECSIFFTLISHQFDLNQITILVPNLMWKVQRRQYSRVRLDGRKQIKATIKLITTNRVVTLSIPVRNIGPGGMGILVDDIHKNLFTTGKIIKEIKFILNEELFFTTATVKWQGALNNKDRLGNYNYCIGLEFMYLTQKEIAYLQSYVLEELHNLEQSM